MPTMPASGQPRGTSPPAGSLARQVDRRCRDHEAEAAHRAALTARQGGSVRGERRVSVTRPTCLAGQHQVDLGGLPHQGEVEAHRVAVAERERPRARARRRNARQAAGAAGNGDSVSFNLTLVGKATEVDLVLTGKTSGAGYAHASFATNASALSGCQSSSVSSLSFVVAATAVDLSG